MHAVSVVELKDVPNPGRAELGTRVHPDHWSLLNSDRKLFLSASCLEH